MGQQKQQGKFHLLKLPQTGGGADTDVQFEKDVTDAQRVPREPSQGSWSKPGVSEEVTLCFLKAYSILRGCGFVWLTPFYIPNVWHSAYIGGAQEICVTE